MKTLFFDFPVSIVKYYLYCPRVPYFVLIHGVRERITELMVEGKEEHSKVLKRLMKKGWSVNVFLKSEKYGIYGYVDAFKKEDDGYVVLEIKNVLYKRKTFKAHLYQTAAYGLLVEENFGRVYKLLVKYKDREISKLFTRGIKNYTVSIINKIHQIYKIGLVSVKVDKNRCFNCGFRNVCKEI